MVEIWWRYGGDMVEIWWRYGGDMVEIWWRYGGDMVEIWWRYGGDMVEICAVEFFKTTPAFSDHRTIGSHIRGEKVRRCHALSA